MDEEDRFRGCLLGLAAGDAVGTAVEWCPRGSFAPLTDMIGGGPFQLRAGQWRPATETEGVRVSTRRLHMHGLDGSLA